MKKIKMEKGITLIALLITVVLLLILAVVSITAIQNEDLIGKVNGAATKYNESVANEADKLGKYEDYFNQYGASITWTQSGITITRTYSTGTITVNVGDTITNFNGESSAWKVLGAEDGKLLIISADGVGNANTLSELESSGILNESLITGDKILTSQCAEYATKEFAESARSVIKTDIEAYLSNTDLKNLVYTESDYWLDGVIVERNNPDEGFGIYDQYDAYYVTRNRISSDPLTVPGYFGGSVSAKVRPVVTLKSNVKLTADGSNAWKLETIEQ